MASEKIEVLLFVPGVPLSKVPNGVCTYASNLIGLLKDRTRVDVLLVAKKILAPDAGAGSVYRYYLEGGSTFRRLLLRIVGMQKYEELMAWRLARFIRGRTDRGPHLVEMEEAFGQSLLVRKHVGAPVVVRLHGPWFLVGANQDMAQDSAYLARVEREGRAIFTADAVSAPSAFVLNAVEAFYKKKIKHKMVLANPFPVFDDAEAWRLGSASKGVVFIGRFDMVKGADVFIEAMFRIASRRPGFHAVFVGPDHGRVKNGEGAWMARDEFVRWCEGVHAMACPVEFMGAKGRDEVASVRRSAAVCVVSSRTEMFSYAVAEALAQGLPTVASRVGGIPEIIDDGLNGLLFENGDVDELCACVEKLLDNADLSVRLSENARLAGREKFSGKALADAYEAFYRSVVDGYVSGAQAPSVPRVRA